MPDFEKVTRGLEACVSDSRLMQCANCPYHTDKSRCITTLMRDALALLKEREARVMSFNELKFDAVYWIELKDVIPWPVAMARMCGNPERLVFVDYHGDEWDISKYRIKEGGWRCWISRPSEEPRVNTPCEVDNNA